MINAVTWFKIQNGVYKNKSPHFSLAGFLPWVSSLGCILTETPGGVTRYITSYTNHFVYISLPFYMNASLLIYYLHVAVCHLNFLEHFLFGSSYHLLHMALKQFLFFSAVFLISHLVWHSPTFFTSWYSHTHWETDFKGSYPNPYLLQPLLPPYYPRPGAMAVQAHLNLFMIYLYAKIH